MSEEEKTKLEALRRWADYAKKAIAKAEEIEKRTGGASENDKPKAPNAA